AGSAEAELLALNDLRGEQISGQSLQDVFLGEAVELQVGWDFAEELDQVEIEKGIAPLDRVGEDHPVAVIGKEVVREAELAIEIGPLVERMASAQALPVDQGETSAVELGQGGAERGRVEG